MSAPSDYLYIRAWGQMMGSYSYYINDRVDEARAERAPHNALYRQDDGAWITTDDITSAVVRMRLGLDPLAHQPPHLATILADLHTAIRLTERFRTSSDSRTWRKPTSTRSRPDSQPAGLCG